MLLFQSPAALKLNPTDSNLKVRVAMEAGPWSKSSTPEVLGPFPNWAKYVAAPKPEKKSPGFEIRVGADAVVMRADGTADLLVRVLFGTDNNAAKSVLGEVSGGELEELAVDEAGCGSRKAGGFHVVKDCILRMKLRNLNRDFPVTIKAKNQDKVEHDPVSRPVRLAW
jgi:hypothetical protein